MRQRYQTNPKKVASRQQHPLPETAGWEKNAPSHSTEGKACGKTSATTSTRTRKAGFSMVELMVVLVTISILAGAISWGVGSFVQRSQMRAAINEIVQLLRETQARAADFRRIYRVQIVQHGESYTYQTPPFMAGTAVNGTVFITQGTVSSPIAQAFKTFSPTIDDTNVERRIFEFARAYRDVGINYTFYVRNAKEANTPMELYFFPDRSIKRCSLSGTIINCVENEAFHTCLRVNTTVRARTSDFPAKIIVENNMPIKASEDDFTGCLGI